MVDEPEKPAKSHRIDHGQPAEAGTHVEALKGRSPKPVIASVGEGQYEGYDDHSTPPPEREQKVTPLGGRSDEQDDRGEPETGHEDDREEGGDVEPSVKRRTPTARGPRR